MELKTLTDQLISILRASGMPQKEIEHRITNLTQAEGTPSNIDSIGDRYHGLAHEIKCIDFLQKFGTVQVSRDSSSTPGCDFTLNKKYLIESVCASAGDIEKNGFKEYCNKNTLGEIVDYNKKQDILYSRLTSVIKEKRDFYQRHKDKGVHNSPDNPYIIFLGIGPLASEMFSGKNGSALTGILFGRGHLRIIINKETLLTENCDYTHRPQLTKEHTGSPINCNIFCSEEYRCVSGILFTGADIFDPYDLDNTYLFINPFSDISVSEKDFRDIVYWSANQDGTYDAKKNGYKCP